MGQDVERRVQLTVRLVDRPARARPEQRRQVGQAPLGLGVGDLLGHLLAAYSGRSTARTYADRRRLVGAAGEPGDARRPGPGRRVPRRGPATSAPTSATDTISRLPSDRCTTPRSLPSSPNTIGVPCTSGMSMLGLASRLVIFSKAPSLNTLQFWSTSTKAAPLCSSARRNVSCMCTAVHVVGPRHEGGLGPQGQRHGVEGRVHRPERRGLGDLRRLGRR